MNIFLNKNCQFNNSPNFKSNIKFVTSKQFDTLMFNNGFYCTNPKDKFEKSFKRGRRIWTWGIRTCTAGGVVDSQGVTGFHIYPDSFGEKAVKSDFMTIMRNFIDIRVRSALLLGSKELNTDPCSVPIFDIISSKLKRVVIPSEFKTFTHASAEADIGYSKDEDTWYINTNHVKDRRRQDITEDVTTLDGLKSSFKSIKIAPQDRLFIGEKEITHKDAPEIFI